MEYEKEIYLDEIIEEKDEKGNSITFKTSELIKIINENYLNRESFDKLDYENFGKKFLIPKIICQKTKVKDYFIHKEFYYDNAKLLSNPKIIVFTDLELKSKSYKIYNINYVHYLIQELKISNPVIICDKKEYSFSTLEDIFYSLTSEFEIVAKRITKFDTLFPDANRPQKANNDFIDIKTGSELTPNFKYYFKCPMPEEKFNFIESSLRSEIFSFRLKHKIIGLCGPMGIGKTTTLLALTKLKKNYCYFNIRALNDNERHILIWKENLLLLEVAYAMKNNYTLKQFNSLKESLENISFFWDAIVFIVEYFIKNEIKIVLILDQYKEKLDPKYKYIKKISDILEKDTKNIIYIIISSSINDKDVRNSLLYQWLKEKKKNIFDYKYYNLLIKILDYIKKDITLTENQRDMIINDFNSIPKYYYSIRTLKENELVGYKQFQINKISHSIEEFFSESENLLENIPTLITLRGSFGQSLDKNQFIQLLRILPFKYFTFDLTKNTVDFYFPLVKDIFDDFLSDKICCFLKSPISSLKEGTIGDILELNLVNDLRKNCFCEFDQIIKVDSVWNITKVDSVMALAESKSILILQGNTEAKYIDFAILNNSDSLLLYQCKKALKKIPDSFITRQIVEYHKNYLMEKFKEYFKVSIKKIYLFYITGITFFKKDNKFQFRTWGVNEKENFSANKIIASSASAELFYYDVVSRKIFLENEKKFEPIDNIIMHANNFSSPILIKPNEDIKNEKDEINVLEQEEIAALGKKIKKIHPNSDELFFFTPTQKAYLKKNYAKIYNNKIIGYLKEPRMRDLNFERMIGLKRGNKNYLLIEKINKVKDMTKKRAKKSKEKNIKKGKNENNIELQEELEENEEENKIQKKRNLSLFLVKDDGLEEVENIKMELYNNVECAYIFEKNIVLQ